MVNILLTVLFVIGTLFVILLGILGVGFVLCKLDNWWCYLKLKYKIVKTIDKILSIICNVFLCTIVIFVIFCILIGLYQSSYQLLWG